MLVSYDTRIGYPPKQHTYDKKQHLFEKQASLSRFSAFL
jgi:hypothetical protein